MIATEVHATETSPDQTLLEFLAQFEAADNDLLDMALEEVEDEQSRPAPDTNQEGNARDR